MDGIFAPDCRESRKLTQDAETEKNQDLGETKGIRELDLEEKVSEILWTLSGDKFIPLTVIASRQEEYSKLKGVIQDTLKTKFKWRILFSMYHRIQDNATEAKIPSREFFLSSSPITNGNQNRARSFAWKIFLKKHRDRMYYCALNPQRRRKKTPLDEYAGKWCAKTKRKWYKPAQEMLGKLSFPASSISDNDCKTNGQPCECLQRQSTSSLVSVKHSLLLLLEKCLVDQVKALLRQQGASQGMALSAIAGLPHIQKCTRQIRKATKIKFVWKRFLAKYQNRFSCSLKCLSRKKTEIIVSLKRPVSSEQRVESITSTNGQVNDGLACTNEKKEHCYSRNVRSRSALERELKSGIRQFVIKRRRRKRVPLAFVLRSRDFRNIVREMQAGPFDRKLLVNSLLQRYRGEIKYKKRRVHRTKRKGPLLSLRGANPVKFDRKRLRALKVRCFQPPGATAKETQELPYSGLLAKNSIIVPLKKSARKPKEASLGTSDTENKGSKRERRLESVSEDTDTVEHSAQNRERKTRRFRDRGSSRNAFLNSLLQRKESNRSTERESFASVKTQTATEKSPTKSEVYHGSSTGTTFQSTDAKETILQSEVTITSNFANYDRAVRIPDSDYKKVSVTRVEMKSFAEITKEDARNKTPPQVRNLQQRSRLFTDAISQRETHSSLEAHQSEQNVVTNKANLRGDCITETDKRFGQAKRDQGNPDQDWGVADAENISSQREDVSRCNQLVYHVAEVKTEIQPCPNKIESVGDQETDGKEYKKEPKGPSYQKSTTKTTMNSPGKQPVSVLVEKDAGRSRGKDSRNNTPSRCFPKNGICNNDRRSAGAIPKQGKKFQNLANTSKNRQQGRPHSSDENIPWSSKSLFSNTEHVSTSTSQGTIYTVGRGRQRGRGGSNFRQPRGRGNWGRGQSPTEPTLAKDKSCGIGSQEKLQNQHVAVAGNPATRVNEESPKPPAAANDQQTVSHGRTLRNVNHQKRHPLRSSGYVPSMENLSGTSGSQCFVKGAPTNPRRKAFEQSSLSGLGRISAAAIKVVLSQDCAQAGQNRKVDHRDSSSSKAGEMGVIRYLKRL